MSIHTLIRKLWNNKWVLRSILRRQSYCSCKIHLNKNYDIPKYSLLAGMPATVKKTGVYLDKRYDFVKYPSLDNV